MSVWERIRRGLAEALLEKPAERDEPAKQAAPSSPPSAPVERPALKKPEPDDELLRLERIGLPGGPSLAEAIAVIRRARGSMREAAAVSAAMRAVARGGVPDEVRVACADILATRGDEDQALRLLEGATSAEGLVLAADLYALRGQIARAVGTIERVLARDLDAPGAKERHARWSASLGATTQRRRRLDEATVVAAGPSGPFRLVREVARGGAGTVYEAEDTVLGRRVAYKVHHGRGADRAAVEREARLAAALAGPGVVRVLDVSPVDGWIALEWVARGSVRDVLRLGDVAALVPVARWARGAARALARVHAAGYVHADVKPGNILLRRDDEAILTDFGIARRIGERSEGGSPGYLSPERLAGRASDPRDDVYAFGRVLEDVFTRLDAAVAAGALPPERAEGQDAWRKLALACLGDDAARAEDGAALVRALP
jgi:serine/threonine-protein kinase